VAEPSRFFDEYVHPQGKKKALKRER